MKKLMLFALLCVALVGCGGKDKSIARIYSGKVFVNSMKMNGTGTPVKSVSTSGVSLLSAGTTSLSDPVTTITTTYEGGDISLSLEASANLQGSILNDTPNTVNGVWYCDILMTTETGTVSDGLFGKLIEIGPGETYAFLGGAAFTGSNVPIPGPMTWTIYFYDDPNAPYPTAPTFASYVATHTPRAVGNILFNIVP